MTPEQRDINRKLRVLAYAQESRNVSKTCRYFGISRQTFYEWKRAYEQKGEPGLINRRPGPDYENSPHRLPEEVYEKILYLRQTYHMGPQRIAWYLQRYHDIRISSGAAHRTLVRHGLNRLPKNSRKRSIVTKRYEKQVPGHHVQVDVKFLIFPQKDGSKVKRYQYTAIDDATRIRALKVYKKHTQKNAIDFIDYVVDKFPFRIQTVRTDNGHEFQAQFHWHIEDKGLRHYYIRPRTPRLNGKVERSHKTDKLEFYQLLEYTGDVDLNKKLKEWENFYNCHRPHGAFKGKTPYEILKEKMNG